jgi:hypothetical protein
MFNPAYYRTFDSYGPERLLKVQEDFLKLGWLCEDDDFLCSYLEKVRALKFVGTFLTDEREMYKGEEWARFNVEYHKTLAVFTSIPINQRWHEMTRSLKNPESFLDGVTLDMVNLRIDRNYNAYYTWRYRWHTVGDESYTFVSSNADLELDSMSVFKLFTDRAIDIIMAVSALPYDQSGARQCCKIYYNEDEGYTIGDDRHPLFKSPECQSYYCEKINPKF